MPMTAVPSDFGASTLKGIAGSLESMPYSAASGSYVGFDDRGGEPEASRTGAVSALAQASAQMLLRLSFARLRPVGTELALPGFTEPAEWTSFLAALEAPPVGLSRHHARYVRQAWAELRNAVGPSLPLPLAEPGEDGALKLAWSTPNFYAELEVLADGTHEWFVRDRVRDVHDGSRSAEAGSLPRPFLSFLQVACRG